jgi:hypothetical protein
MDEKNNLVKITIVAYNDFESDADEIVQRLWKHMEGAFFMRPVSVDIIDIDEGYLKEADNGQA